MSDLLIQQPKQHITPCELQTCETPTCTPCEDDSAIPYFDQVEKKWIGLNRGDKVVSVTQASLDLDLRVQLYVVEPWEYFCYDVDGQNGKYIWYDCLIASAFSRDAQGVNETWPLRKRRYAVARAESLARQWSCIVLEGVTHRDKCKTFEWMIEQVSGFEHF